MPDEADQFEVYCPNCRQHVTPLKASLEVECPL